MRTLVTAVAAVMIAGAACGQFKANQTSTSGPQSATTIVPAAQSLDEARRIPRDEAIKMVREGKAVWIDVRSKVDYENGHIKGATNIPLPELQQSFNKLPPHKFLITYCA